MRTLLIPNNTLLIPDEDPLGGPIGPWPLQKIILEFYFFYFLFFIKISAKGPLVLLSLSFHKIFKIIINNLKHNGIEDPLEDPSDDPSD